MKVSMRDERLARSLLWIRLIDCGFPEDKTEERVNEAWPGLLKKARDINFFCNLVGKDELNGSTTEEEINRWSDDPTP